MNIRFKHSSISREHCVLNLDEGIKILDKDSRSGTFRMVNSLQLKKKCKLLFNVGKKLIEIHPFKSKPCKCIKLKNHRNL